jgi:hypothetical protein
MEKRTPDDTPAKICGHVGCVCDARDIAAYGEQYCSEACAEGVGCQHEECDCGSLDS